MVSCYLLLYLLFYTNERRVLATSKAIVIWTLILFSMTEILSCFQGIRFWPVLLSWIVVDITLLLLLWRKKNGTVREMMKKAFSCRVLFEKKELLFFVALAGMLGLMALRTVPYNWDSQTYHLPRIMHWAQNGSVAHYATNIIRQISSPVLAEFVNLHIWILTGRDLLFNMLQCLSFLMGAVIIYDICQNLGAERITCFMGTMLYITMPIGFAEALTTQVDNYASLMFLIYVRILMEMTYDKKSLEYTRTDCGNVCLLGLCAAWGYLIKPSVLFGMVVFAIWLLVVCVRRRDSWRIIGKLLLFAIPCFVLPLIPEFSRNYHTFHALASAGTGKRQLIGTLKPTYVFVNFLKNLAFNLPNFLWPGGSGLLEKLIAKVAVLLNVELNDVSISEDGRIFAMHSAGEYRHDMALNPLIVWMFLICMIIGCIMYFRKKGGDRRKRGYCISAALSFLVFCALLRWEPFVSRYMISYLAALCPCIVLVVQKLQRQIKNKAGKGIIFGGIVALCMFHLVGMAWYHVDMCRSTKAGVRPVGYFASRGTYHSYEALCGVIRENQYIQVGLLMTEDSYEYPIWQMLRGTAEKIEHVNITNETAELQEREFHPDCIISTVGGMDASQQLSVYGNNYQVEEQFDDGLCLFVRQ